MILSESEFAGFEDFRDWVVEVVGGMTIAYGLSGAMDSASSI